MRWGELLCARLQYQARLVLVRMLPCARGGNLQAGSRFAVLERHIQ